MSKVCEQLRQPLASRVNCPLQCNKPVGRMGQREREKYDEGSLRGVARPQEVDGGEDVARVSGVVDTDVRCVSKETEIQSFI